MEYPANSTNPYESKANRPLWTKVKLPEPRGVIHHATGIYEPNYEPLKRFTDYKEIRELVKKQEAEIEHLRKVVDGLLDVIKGLSKGD